LDRHKQFIVSLAALLMVTTVVLAALVEWRLEVYVSLFAVCYFTASALFRPRRRGFDFVGGALFASFCLIVAVKVVQILGLRLVLG
jgi:hypothetical protein